MDTNTGEIIAAQEAERRELEDAKVESKITGKPLTQVLEMRARQDDREARMLKPNHLPDPNCRHCYGRGHQGQDRGTGKYIPCICVTRERANAAQLTAEQLAMEAELNHPAKEAKP